MTIQRPTKLISITCIDCLFCRIQSSLMFKIDDIIGIYRLYYLFCTRAIVGFKFISRWSIFWGFVCLFGLLSLIIKVTETKGMRQSSTHVVYNVARRKVFGAVWYKFYCEWWFFFFFFQFIDFDTYRIIFSQFLVGCWMIWMWLRQWAARTYIHTNTHTTIGNSRL